MRTVTNLLPGPNQATTDIGQARPPMAAPTGPQMHSGASWPEVLQPPALRATPSKTSTLAAQPAVSAAERYQRVQEARAFLKLLASHTELREYLRASNTVFEVAPFLFLTKKGLIGEWPAGRDTDTAIARRRVTFGIPIPGFSERLSEHQLAQIDLPGVRERLAALFTHIARS